jgi:hypothetical protein
VLSEIGLAASILSSARLDAFRRDDRRVPEIGDDEEEEELIVVLSEIDREREERRERYVEMEW